MSWTDILKEDTKGRAGDKEYHITWGNNDKTWGWLNGRIYFDLAGWAAKNKGKYTESVSDMAYLDEKTGE